ncbi:MAG TPA: heme-copper oxidase subunit III [Candidatus Polarisedimenticolia bacterium]|nr:heme-copper oxidase subunit III [Candidatus Polarisedimenticolia bacterium]
MPGTSAIPDIEIIVEDIRGGGGGPTPPPGGGDDGDGGGDDRNRRRKWSPSPKRYSTAITIGIVSILMFFMALASAFIVLRRGSDLWVTVHLPRILWANTCVLLASSFTLESARKRLYLADASGFRKFWLMTTVLGFLFVTGQLVAWRQLVAQGVYIASNQASSFFYIFTGAHAVHLLGGVGALLFVGFRKFEKAKISLPAAAEITSYYWHFMDGLWIFLLALLYLGK